MPTNLVQALLLTLCAAAANALAAEPAGSVLFSQGVTTAQREGQPTRIVGKGDPVQVGDVLSTGATSFAVLQLQDGSRMTLRPATVFSMERFSQEPGQESAWMRLFKGGLRTVTGLIGKKNPAGYELRTSTATIGIRGTDFDARLCERDCAQESGRVGVAAAGAAERAVVGRVALVNGQASASAAGAAPRPLVAGSPIYNGDLLETGRDGFAVVAFRDQTRFTLQAATRFAVENFRFEGAGRESSALFRLLRGGLRAVTGLIGKSQPQAFRLQTATATIGIRGTGMDVWCGGPCALESPPARPPGYEPGGSPEDGLIVSTWEGLVEVLTSLGVKLVPVGETVLVVAPDQPPRNVPVPEFMRQTPAPRPDTVPVDFQNLFGARERSADDAGLYVWVRDGHVALSTAGQTFDLGRNESLFVGLQPDQVYRIELPPTFMRFDSTPRPDTPISPSNLGSPLRDRSGASTDLECRI